MIERKIEDMCVVCNDHDKPSCGYEERGLQRKCPYNDFIERGYELAEKDLALTWEDIRKIDELLTLVYDPDNEEGYYTRVLEEFNIWREKK